MKETFLPRLNKVIWVKEPSCLYSYQRIHIVPSHMCK